MNDDKLIKEIVSMYNKANPKHAEYYMGLYKDLKELGTIDLNNLEYYNKLLKTYGLKMELDPEEKDYVLIFKSEYEFKPEDLKI